MRKHSSAVEYHKEHVFEDIQELYKIACLEYGYHPIKFVRNSSDKDYALCEAVIAEAKRITDAGGGHIAFSSIIEKEVRKNNGRYSYRVYPDSRRSRNNNAVSSGTYGNSDSFCGGL